MTQNNPPRVKSGLYQVYRNQLGHEPYRLARLWVIEGVIRYESHADEANCDIFPPGPLTPYHERRFLERLNNPGKNPYLTLLSEWN